MAGIRRSQNSWRAKICRLGARLRELFRITASRWQLVYTERSREYRKLAI